MKLSEHFSVDEFTQSDTAKRLGIDNSLPPELLLHATATASMLEAIRAYLSAQAGKEIPVNITSGYRCEALNKAIGSANTSDHIKAYATDIKAPAFGSALTVSRALAPKMDALGIGQIIYEFGSWVHVSSRKADKTINRMITINKSGVHVGIVE
jgi:zinc D-Ala-D-Ala carboxypeptidase